MGLDQRLLVAADVVLVVVEVDAALGQDVGRILERIEAGRLLRGRRGGGAAGVVDAGLGRRDRAVVSAFLGELAQAESRPSRVRLTRAFFILGSWVQTIMDWRIDE
ncbi:hypothetical protein [Chitinimonas koreensis]|uniref:hypothetical protein n=1 Tax=Chitinimonas koreensis TaxID=356302 RepID=UPI002240B9C5|nr:hypothetical protein [Chitinimonas koreensis]